jgi:hypothetical protein
MAASGGPPVVLPAAGTVALPGVPDEFFLVTHQSTRRCRGSTPLLFLVRVLGTSWDKGCMAASASGNIVAGLRNQIRLVGVYGQLVGLRFPL